jgi:hypothetical protein
MEEQKLFEPEVIGRYDHLTREELINRLKVERKIVEYFRKEFTSLLERYGESGDKLLLIEDQLVWLRNELFGKSSEKERPESGPEVVPDSSPKPRIPRVHRLTDRYADVPRIERHTHSSLSPEGQPWGKL